jgi:hypothetical protein
MGKQIPMMKFQIPRAWEIQKFKSQIPRLNGERHFGTQISVIVWRAPTLVVYGVLFLFIGALITPSAREYERDICSRAPRTQRAHSYK